MAVDEDRVRRHGHGRLRDRLRDQRRRSGNDAPQRAGHGVAGRVAARIGVVKVPMPSISIVTTSPGFRNSGGLRPAPTPSGVPLEITSPGYSVNVDVRKRTMCASSQIRFFVLPSCFTTPLTFVTM